MNATWKAVVGVILVFILGWFGGALTTLVIAHQRTLLLLQRDPEPLAKLLERQTTRNLGLDEDKRQQLHALILANLKQRMALQKQIQPQVKALNAQTLQQINALLTPDQQEQFHENLVTLKRRFGRNPFNVNASDDAPAPTQPESVGAATNAADTSK
jgi:hypothetical protein